MTESSPRWRVTYKRHAADSKEEHIVVTAYDLINALKLARQQLDLVLHAKDMLVAMGLPPKKRCYKLIAAVEVPKK